MSDQHSPNDAHDRPDCGSDEALEARGLQTVFKIDDAEGSEKSEPDRRRPTKAKRFNNERGTSKYDCENSPDENDIQEVALFLLDVNIQLALGGRGRSIS